MKKENKKYIAAAAILAVAAALILALVFINRKGDNLNGDTGQAGEAGKQNKKGAEEVRLPEGETENTDALQANEAIKAMYLPYGEDMYLFIDVDRETPFTAPIPAEGVSGRNGESIGQEDLNRGDILKIYGNNIMLESYPAQYPGVTRMELYQEGTPEDADRYNDLIDQIYEEPDPAEPPYLSIEYSQPEANVSASITRGGYTWNYEKEDGTTDSVIADAVHVLEWKEINDLKLNGTQELKLQFSHRPQSVEAARWPEGQRGAGLDSGTIPEGEKVEVSIVGEDYLMKSPEPGYVYSVHAFWENGDVEYGFLTK